VIFGGIKMRLRRLEFIVIGVTLAFACFMGGFFTGRNWSAVNITTVATQNEAARGVGISSQNEANPGSSSGGDITPAVPAPSAADNSQPAAEGNGTGSQPEKTGEPRGGDGRININIASLSELTDLPGIGNVLASRIVDYRREHGDFQRIEDIRNVSGIGERRFEAIQERITVGN